MPEALQTTNAGSTQSRVRLISTRQPDDPGVKTPQPEAPPSPSSSPAFLAQLVPMLIAIAAVAAARILLLIGLMGAIGLTYLAMQNPDPYRLAATFGYDVLSGGPLTWLYLKKG